MNTIHLPHFPLSHPVDDMAAWEAVLGDNIKGAWDHFVQFVTSGNELQVWRTRDRRGTTLWHVYDPVTGANREFGSEADVRVWIEDRYYN
jgi:hypothetical protein